MNLKKIIYLSSISLGFLMFYSCNNEDDSLIKDTNHKPLEEKLSFNSKMNVLKFKGNKNDIKLFIDDPSNKEKLFLEYYESGFIPLSISSDIKDNNVINNITNKLKQNKISSKTNINTHESFLEDHELASILNNNGALQLNDSIYVYTPNGLFFVHEDDYDELEYYLEKNQNINISTGLNQITNEISSYRPDTNKLPVDFEMIAPEDPYDGGGYSGGGSGYSSPTIPLKNQTNHYKNCNEGISNPFLGNIFGKQYECIYYFDNDHQVKTVFEIQDFYLFYSVRAKNKFRRKGTFGWRTDDARKLYLKINDGLLKIERKTYEVKLNNSQIKPVIDAVNNLITVKSRPIPIINSEYILNSSGTYTQTNYIINSNDLYYNTSDMLIFPQQKQIQNSVNMDSFKNMLNTTKKSIIYVNIFNKDFNITHNDLINMAAKLFTKYATSGRQNSDIAIVMNEVKAQNDKINASPMYIITKDEIIEADNTHKVIKDFDVKKDFDLKEFVITFSTNTSGSNKFGINMRLGVNNITEYKMDIEGGIFYNNSWGGTKFVVEKK